jgi:hypothetical protein
VIVGQDFHVAVPKNIRVTLRDFSGGIQVETNRAKSTPRRPRDRRRKWNRKHAPYVRLGGSTAATAALPVLPNTAPATSPIIAPAGPKTNAAVMLASTLPSKWLLENSPMAQ